MESVYLLLRNNQQTGPFTIGELLQQQLKPSDMIWIEGKSTAWTYLSELELIPHLTNYEVQEQKPSPKTHDEIERKAEELRQRILTSAPKTYFPGYITEIETYASPYQQSEEEIQIVDHRKERREKKNTVLGELVLTCFVIGLFMLGIYRGKSFLGVRDRVQTTEATQLNSRDQHAAQKVQSVQQQPGIIAVADTIHQQDSLLALQRTKQKVAVVKKPFDSSILVSSQTLNVPLLVEEKKAETTPTTQLPEENIRKDIPKKEITPVIPEVKSDSAPKEEKKGFLKGLFKKKKKEQSATDKEE
jgi:hypothetical protein